MPPRRYTTDYFLILFRMNSDLLAARLYLARRSDGWKTFSQHVEKLYGRSRGRVKEELPPATIDVEHNARGIGGDQT